MKILVAQLARLGDIYLTWPILNGLCRQHPEAEVHFLVRERYAGACEGLNPAIKVHQLATRELLEPIYCDGNEEQSLRRCSRFVDSLLEQSFDKVINLSFSPFSSFLTHAFERLGAQVHGYTRHPDGYFQVADEGSAYFYAQVGAQSYNRYHLLDLFALISGVQLLPSDMSGPELSIGHELLSEAYMCLHVGASEAEKAMPAELIADLVHKICADQKLRLILVGSADESSFIEAAIKGQSYEGRLVNLVGATSVEEAFAVVSRAYLVLGADSFAMHVSSLSSTPCVNLSCEHVNFWETGPLGQGSRVIYHKTMAEHSAEEIWSAVEEVLSSEETSAFVLSRSDRLGEPRFHGELPNASEFQWRFISALYSGTPFPVLDEFTVYKNLVSLAKMSQVALETLPDVLQPDKRKATFELLSQIDMAIDSLARQDCNLFPLIRWFQTKKIRLGPQDLDQLVQQTHALFESLLKVTHIYVAQEDAQNKEIRP